MDWCQSCGSSWVGTSCCSWYPERPGQQDGSHGPADQYGRDSDSQHPTTYGYDAWSVHHWRCWPDASSYHSTCSTPYAILNRGGRSSNTDDGAGDYGARKGSNHVWGWSCSSSCNQASWCPRTGPGRGINSCASTCCPTSSARYGPWYEGGPWGGRHWCCRHWWRGSRVPAAAGTCCSVANSGHAQHVGQVRF